MPHSYMRLPGVNTGPSSGPPRFSFSMLDRFLGRLHGTKHGAPVLRGYLWWGLFIRGVLLAALGTLLLVEGNVLAECLLTARVPFVSQDEGQELAAISYNLPVLLLAVGTGPDGSSAGSMLPTPHLWRTPRPPPTNPCASRLCWFATSPDPHYIGGGRFERRGTSFIPTRPR